MEQARHEHSESLSSAALKRTREEGEGIESSLAKRLRSEESHGNLQGTLVENIAHAAAQKRALDIPSDNTSFSNKKQKLGEGSSSSSDFQNLKNVTSGESHSNAHNDKFEAPTERAHYRLGENGWKERSPSAAGNGLEGQWEKTDHFDKNNLGEGTRKEALAGELLLHKNINCTFIEHHSQSRRDGIANKIKPYSDELNKPETQQKPEERDKLTNLNSVLTAALKYQNSIIGHLAKSETSPDPKIKALQCLSRISEAIKLDERPNKIEVLAEKLEHDYTQLATYQERVQVLQIEIDQQAEPMGEDDPEFIGMDHLLKAITHQSDLIKARVARATLIRPPYETLSEIQQADLSANKWLCIEKEALARSEELLARALLLDSDPFFHRGAARVFQKVAEEAQKPEPNQQIIDWFTQAASLLQQSAEEEEEKAEYLNNAGYALSKAAREATEPYPNQQIINWFTEAASNHKQAAKEIAEGRDKIAEHLNTAGHALSNAAEEAEKTYTENRALSERFDMDMVKFHEGVEAAFDDDYVETLFLDAAEAYRSFISAEETGDTSAATSWRVIGNHYRDAAKECKDFLEKNNLTPRDSRFDAFLNQSIEERPTINARLEEAIRLRNQLGKSKT